MNFITPSKRSAPTPQTITSREGMLCHQKWTGSCSMKNPSGTQSPTRTKNIFWSVFPISVHSQHTLCSKRCDFEKMEESIRKYSEDDGDRCTNSNRNDHPERSLAHSGMRLLRRFFEKRVIDYGCEVGNVQQGARKKDEEKDDLLCLQGPK